MNRNGIYAPSAAMDIKADALEARAKEARAKEARAEAKRLRWANAPAWANCIVSPSKHGLAGLRYRKTAGVVASAYTSPGDPHGESDWRFANRTMFGWFLFDEQGEVRSAAEAGNWSIVEYRP